MGMILRAVEPEDVDFILECENDSLSAKWSDYTAPFSRSQLLTYALTYDANPFSAGQLRLIVVKDGKKIGIADLYDISERDSRATVGISIHPDYRNKGYGTAALNALHEYVKGRLGLRQLIAKVSTRNSIACNFFKKAGYQEITVLPAWHRLGSDFHDFHLLSLSFINS